MTNPWFRLYSKIITDPQIEFLSFEDQRHFVWLLCLKNEGFLDQDYGDDARMIDRVVARKLGLQGEAFDMAKVRLIQAKLIDGDWQPRSWDELQFKSDNSRERVRKYRERKKKPEMKRPCNVTVTAQDTDTDTEQNRESARTLTKASFFCPQDFNPDQDQLRMARYAAGVNLENELAKFRNHEFPTPKSDWNRAFLKWLAGAQPEKKNADGLNDLERKTNQLLGI